MSALLDIVAANRSGSGRGIPSWCTAHEATLRAILKRYRDGSAPILIEATCNQVNQFGGYTGMKPAGFRAFVEGLAVEAGVAPGRLILGGDHLGPNPWKSEPAAVAMEKAKAMVADYVAAGFTKIHLDASMACADDGILSEGEMAARAADLCAVAEAGGRDLTYVIGTEVPIPGGELAPIDTLAVTRPDAARRTYHLHCEAFRARGLERALERVAGIVAQPGVDFGNDQVFAFAPDRAADLSRAVLDLPGLVFEAHSTDYQTGGALAALVRGHFAILKVGPELTFAYRQAIFALAGIEAALDCAQPSRIIETITEEMRQAPDQWRPYVAANAREGIMMLQGLSDRVRYYWPNPRIAAALRQLNANLSGARPEPGLIAQFTGGLVEPVPEGDLMTVIVERMVGQVVEKYRHAAA